MYICPFNDKINLTISCGIKRMTDGETYADLINISGKMLLNAKLSGKNNA